MLIISKDKNFSFNFQYSCLFVVCPLTFDHISKPFLCLISQGEMNGHRGLVPSNFLEEVPDDVEVYLTETPSRPEQDEHTPTPRPEIKRVHHRRSQR